MPRLDLIRRPQPFIALLLVAGGWAISHQVGSDSVFDDCTARGGGFVALVSLLGLAVIIAGALYGMSAWRLPEQRGRSFFGLVVSLLGLIAGLAVLLQLAAGLILPPCAA